MTTTSSRPAWRWRLAEPPPGTLLEGLRDLHPVLVAALFQRGLRDPAAARAFLAHDAGSADPHALAGVPEAVERLAVAVRRGEPVVVYGDFDADGVTATAVLLETLHGLGATVSSFIPHRHRDGYGLHAEALLRLARQGARVVVTVDCGIRGAEAVARAAAEGLDVIVTDHHALSATLPGAVAVINPRRPDCGYGFEELAGVGLAFKLAQAMLRDLRPSGPADRRAPEEHELTDLVALGTVADVVPLHGENRALVQRGLTRLRTGARLGVRALAEVAGIDLKHLSARDIAFGLAPRLNAAGRMDSAQPALDLLLATDKTKAYRLARLLDSANDDRRAATETAVAAAEAALAGRTTEPFLFHVDPNVELGVTGLVAGRLAGRHYRPAAVLRLDGDTARGSARSIPDYDVLQGLDAVAHLLVRHGGHARAAGFTVSAGQLDLVRRLLVEHAARALRDVDLRPTLGLTAEVGPGDLDARLYEALAELEPFGEANPRPLLAVRGARVAGAKVVGRGHLRLSIGNTPQGAMDAIAFGMADRLPDLGREVDLAASLRVNTWSGASRLELRVEDLAAAGA